MLDIEGIQKRTDDAKHYATCPKARNECKRCDDWFYASTNFQSIVRSFVTDIEALLSDVHGSESHRAEIRKALGLPDSIGVVAGASLVVDARDDAKRQLANTRGELDELRTRHARIVDSMESFVSVMVDERFKKDHAAIIAELDNARIKLSLHDRIIAEIRYALGGFPDAIPTADGAAIVCRQRDELSVDNASLRNECRKHLARINALESSIASLHGAPIPMRLYCPMCHVQHVDAGEFATKSHHTHACQSCGAVWRPAIIATVGVQFLPGFKNDTTLLANESTVQDAAKVEDKTKDATNANVVPNNVVRRAIVWANRELEDEPTENDEFLARSIISGAFVPTSPWSRLVAEFVKLWREGQAPDR